MAPKCKRTTGSQCRLCRLCRIEAAFVSLDQDGIGNEEDIELDRMAPKRDLVRADLYCSRSMCLALASLRVEHWRFRAEGLALFLRHVLDGRPRASQSRGNFAAQQKNGRGPG